MAVPGIWIDRAGGRRTLDKLILDLNSAEEFGGRNTCLLARELTTA